MRTLAVAILGVFCGLAAGFLIFDELVGRLLFGRLHLGPLQGTGGAGIGLVWALVIAFGPWVLAVIGAVVAVTIDQRRRAGSS